MGDTCIVGCVGPLVLPTRGADGAGEVHVRVRGGTESFLAWSDAPLPKGESVLVVGVRGPRAVEVVPWSEPPLTVADA